MLHIVLMILKIIGIIILVLLGLLLFLLLAGLFVPLRYRLSARKHEKDWEAGGSVSWLFGAVYVTVRYDGKKPFYECYFLGVPLIRLKKWRDGRKSSQEKKKSRKRSLARKTPYSLEAEVPAVEPQGEACHPYEDSERKKGTGIVPEKPSPKSIFSRIMDKIRALFSLPKRICFTIKENYGKIKKWKSILQSDDVRYLKKMGMARTKAAWGHIRPRKLKGNVTFGFDDPAHTGEALGVLGILYPMFPGKFSVTPMFTESILEGWLEMRGRIYGIFFLVTGLQVLFDGHTIPIIKKFMRKEA